MEGWINLHRQIIESSVFASEKRLKIWIWLLCKANYKDRFVNINIGKGESIIKLQRGQVLFGRFKAEEETCIDGSTIYKILHWFESEKMINIESNSHYTILTISNYDTFQTIEKEKVTTIEQPSNSEVAAEGQPSNTPKKDKKDNNKKNKYKWRENDFYKDIEIDSIFKEFLEMRESLQKPAINSERAITSIKNKLKEIAKSKIEAIKIIEQSIRNSWKDIYPLKSNEFSDRKNVAVRPIENMNAR